MNSKNPNYDNSQQRDMETAVAAVEAPSTKFVQWTRPRTGELGPTTTMFITEPGARIPESVFKGHTLVVTDEQGNKTARDFQVAVQLPQYDQATGTYPRAAGERLAAWSAAQTPEVAGDITIGKPSVEGGPRVVQVSVSGDVLSSMHGLTDTTNRKLDRPDRTFELPDPTFAADDLVRDARQHFGLQI